MAACNISLMSSYPQDALLSQMEPRLILLMGCFLEDLTI